MRSSDAGRVLVVCALLAADCRRPAPHVAAPAPVVSVAPAAEEPAWMREPRDDADRALLARLLDPHAGRRQEAVAEWEDARVASWDAVFKLPRDHWPLKSGLMSNDWAESDDPSTPQDEPSRIVQAFANRTRGLARGLVGALRGGDAPTRAAAATSMGEMRLATGRHLTQACEDSDAAVRGAAIRALIALHVSESSYEPCLPAVIRLLDDADGGVRAAAVQAYAMYANRNSTMTECDETAPQILRLTSDEVAQVRRWALTALSSTRPWKRDAEVAAAFTRALADADAEVRVVAAWWFGGEASRGARHGETNPFVAKAVPSLRRLLDDSDAGVRLAAATVYWEATRDARPVVAILAERIASSHGSALVGPLQTLAEMGPDAEEAVPAILGALSEDTYARFSGSGTEAMDALYAIGPRADATLPLLERMLTDRDPSRRAAAARAIVTLDGDMAPCAAVLRRALDVEKDDGTRGAILASLGTLRLGGDDLLAALVTGLAGSEGERSGAIQALRAFGPRAVAATPHLRKLVAESPDRWTRVNASFALASIGGPAEAVGSLTQVAEYDGAEDVVRIVESVGPGDAALVPVFLVHLDESPAVVARALAEIGPAASEALPDLQRHLIGPDRHERIAAAEAILRIGGDRVGALKVLTDALEPSSDRDLRAQAAYALARAGEVARPATEALRTSLDPRGLEEAGAAAFALWRLTGETEPHLATIRSVISRHSGGLPVGLIDALAAMGPAAAPAVADLARAALTWHETGMFKESELVVSRAAIRALGAIGAAARAALPTLHRLRRNALFRAAAEDAIRRIE